MIFSVRCPCGLVFSVEVDREAGVLVSGVAYNALLDITRSHRKECEICASRPIDLSPLQAPVHPDP